MHVGVDARMWQSSGIGTYLQNLLPALTNHFEVTIIGDVPDLDASLIPSAIPIYSVSELLRFPRLVPQCDVFWSPHYNVPILPIRARRRLVTIHDVFHLAYYHTLSWQQKAYASVVSRAAVHLSDAVITVSEFSRQEIVHYLGISSDKIKVIYNGIDHSLFHPIADQLLQTRVRQRYQLPDRFILFVGNVKPHKNLITLVKAFASLDSQDVHLVIVGRKDGFITGDASLLVYLQQHSALNERIHFTGYVEREDLPVIYHLAQLFVFPSLYEGFGLPPLEAMACGCPVLAAKVASIPEACGAAALYMNPYSVTDTQMVLQQALTLSSEDKQSLIEKGFTQANRFRWAEAVKQHVEVIKQVAISR